MRAIKNRYCLAAVAFLGTALLSQAGTTTRVEQNDPSITYTGIWYPNSQTPNSGGSSVSTNALNAKASITFTGSAITWIGIKDAYNGLATVTVDGTQYTVDTYAYTTLYQQPLFSVSGLGGGKHTLSIQVLHQRDGDTSGSWVYVDAFDIDNGQQVTGQVVASPGLVEQNDPALSYSGKWFPISNGQMSGGSAVESTDLPSSVTLAFQGDGVKWISYRDSGSGIAKVYVDGELRGTVDTYSPTTIPQAVMFSADNLKPPNGTHTITIEVTGTRNASSTAAWVWVDAFQVTGKK
jgi:alpha-amylase